MEKVLRSLKGLVPTGLADAGRPAYHFGLAVLGELIYRFPGRQITVIGVTGTNGKSTSANLIAAVLAAGGHRVGLATTVNFKVGGRAWANQTKMTSPGRFATYKLLRQMVKAGDTHAVIEASSHALHWHRVWGVPFQTAVFTNLSRDHLDLHRTMEAYRNTKGKLFQKLKPRHGKTVSVVNGDDPEAAYFLQFLADEKYVYGVKPETAEVMPLAQTVLADEIESGSTGSTFVARVDGTTIPVQVNIPGAFNVANALAAVCVGLAHGVALETIGRAIGAVPGVPGRMERVEAGQPFPVIVDYAHTPDAFDNVFSTLRAITPGRLISVFGATGDRDQGKRPELGRIAAGYSDFMFLTEEDPASEDPLAIISQIIPGIEAAGKTQQDYEIVPKRRTAINQALQLAKRDDTVVLLAKGHETVMTYADGKKPWDDRTVVAEEWQKLAETS